MEVAGWVVALALGAVVAAMAVYVRRASRAWTAAKAEIEARKSVDARLMAGLERKFGHRRLKRVANEVLREVREQGEHRGVM